MLYDAPEQRISENTARKIESASWQNTLRLIPEEEREEVLSVPMPAVQQQAEASLSDEEKRLLALFFFGTPAEATAYATEQRLVLMTVCERINDFFVDTIGDVVLLLDGDNIEAITDYETEVRAFLASEQV